MERASGTSAVILAPGDPFHMMNNAWHVTSLLRSEGKDVQGLQPERLFIVPGNHDLDRTAFDFLPAKIAVPFKEKKANRYDKEFWLHLLASPHVKR